MKLNFHVPFLQLDGTPYKEINGDDMLLSTLLANALSTHTEGIEPLKALDWMLKLKNGDLLDLDRADQDKLKKLIDPGFRGMQILIRGRLLEIFEKKEETGE